MGVRHLMPPAIRAYHVDINALHLKPVFRTQGAEKKFRTELIKTVAAQIIGAVVDEQAAVDPKHFHAIFQGDWKIKNMFERASIENNVKPFPEFGLNGLVQIMHQPGALEI